MAYKMKGFGGFGNSPAKQKGKILTPKSKLRKSEHEDTWIARGASKSGKINDLQDRIEFLTSDMQENPTPQQKKDLASLRRELSMIRKTGK